MLHYYEGYKDLLHLYKDLDEVAAKWDSFGVQLGIPYGKLQGFRGGASKADRCFTGLLEAWLRGQETNDRSNAINQLVSALRMPGVDQGGLANEIDQNRDGMTHHDMMHTMWGGVVYS